VVKINRLFTHRCNGNVSDKEFLAVERNLGINLPIFFKDVLSNCDAGLPKKDCINFFDLGIEKIYGACIGRFLSMKSSFPHEYGRILGVNDKKYALFPPGIIAFAADPFGNYFCFDYREGRENVDPPVVFWQHEAAGRPEAITPLAPNFEAFLGMLKTEEEAEAEFQEMKKKYETAEL
jgi:hypothetical protein